MAVKLTSLLIICCITCTVTLAEPGMQRIRIRFPGPSSDKIVLPKPAKQQVAPYPPAGFKPEPAFELPPEVAYGPPAETYGPPAAELELTYGPPEPELTYGPPAETYGPPEFNNIQSAAIVNVPLQLASQFTPPRPNKAGNFRPQSAAIVNAPLKPVNYLTVPRPERIVAFRPRRPQNQGQKYFPATYLTLPHVQRLIQFAPKRTSNRRPQQQSNRFSRPLPSSIFGKSNDGRSGRQLPINIFSN